MLSGRDLIRCEYLVLRCKQRDSGAAAELTGLFQRSLLYYLRRLVNSEPDAWDLLQETWLSVFRSLNSLEDARALPAFLFRVARNHAMAHLRKRRPAEAVLSSVDPPAPNGQPEVEFSPDDAAAVHSTLERLPLAHREVLTLFFFQDLSIGEIACVLGVPPGTVKSRLYHAKQSLRVMLAKGDSHGSHRV